MPPSHHSSSSHSSHSHSSSSHSHSSSSHSSHSYGGSHSGSSYSSERTYYHRTLKNQPKDVPKSIKKSRTIYYGKKHNYTYYNEGWSDKNGTFYNAGFYDENGKYYKENEIIFKNGSKCKAVFVCDYCGNKMIKEWNEGSVPNCDKCGAIMNYDNCIVEELMSTNTSKDRKFAFTFFGILALIFFAPFIFGLLIFMVIGIIMLTPLKNNFVEYDDSSNNAITNVDIYGRDLYLDLIDEDRHIYTICDETDDYEKHLTYDYGYESYYDIDTDCYVWYNTDVAPNLWQYWWEETSSKYDSGWMECENNTWYVETTDGNWRECTNTDLRDYYWHIENRFDNEDNNEDTDISNTDISNDDEWNRNSDEEKSPEDFAERFARLKEEHPYNTSLMYISETIAEEYYNNFNDKDFEDKCMGNGISRYISLTVPEEFSDSFKPSNRTNYVCNDLFPILKNSISDDRISLSGIIQFEDNYITLLVSGDNRILSSNEFDDIIDNESYNLSSAWYNAISDYVN